MTQTFSVKEEISAMTKRKKQIRGLAILLLGVTVLAIVLFVLYQNEKKQYPQKRSQMSEGFGTLKTVEWGGQTYREKPAVTTLLIAGIDREKPIEENNISYRDGGQADFLLLVSIDHTDKKIYRLQIDRDTMTDVVVLGVFGNEVGTRILQICLAHSFGATPEQNAKYTLQAVQNLLGGLEIDGYYTIDYSAVPVLNDALGGVPVDIEFDMTRINPAWVPGSTVVLNGKEAEEFVRARMNIGTGTNEERMIRQNEYMNNAIALMKQKLSSDLQFGERFLSALKDYAVSNFSQTRLLDELNQAYNYEIKPIDHPDGEYTYGKDGFIEFHIDKSESILWVLEHLYTKVE